MRSLLLLSLTACGGSVLPTLPPAERAPLCRQLNAPPTGTFGCSSDQVPGFGEGKRYAAELHFQADGRLDKFTGLHEVRDALADATRPAPECVADELRGWRLEGLTGPAVLPVVVTYEGGPTDFREAALEGSACSVRITFENH